MPPPSSALARELQFAPVVAQLLLNRGLGRSSAAKRFLDAPLAGLHPPELLPGVKEAADRLFDAVRQNRKVCVYGDYDADGVTGTALLKTALELVGGRVDVYVPHRLEEGYGLNAEALGRIAADGGSLVVTVDCGIASIAEAEEAPTRAGVGHHRSPRVQGPASCRRRPRASASAGHDLSVLVSVRSGGGLQTRLALCQRACGGDKVTPRFREFLLDAVALAALGIVADVVPLHDENRILVRYGLSRLRQQPPAGLKALIKVAGLTAADLKASDVGYKLAPRINAAGRLGCARLVVELLTTADADRALSLARYLEGENSKRQTLERDILRGLARWSRRGRWRARRRWY